MVSTISAMGFLVGLVVGGGVDLVGLDVGGRVDLVGLIVGGRVVLVGFDVGVAVAAVAAHAYQKQKLPVGHGRSYNPAPPHDVVNSGTDPAHKNCSTAGVEADGDDASVSATTAKDSISATTTGDSASPSNIDDDDGASSHQMRSLTPGRSTSVISPTVPPPPPVVDQNAFSNPFEKYPPV